MSHQPSDLLPPSEFDPESDPRWELDLEWDALATDSDPPSWWKNVMDEQQ